METLFRRVSGEQILGQNVGSRSLRMKV